MPGGHVIISAGLGPSQGYGLAVPPAPRWAREYRVSQAASAARYGRAAPSKFCAYQDSDMSTFSTLSPGCGASMM